MLAVIRLVLIASCVLVGLGVAELFPLLFSQKNLYSLGALFTAVGAIYFWLMQKINDLASLSGLTETEHDRLVMSLKEYRQRVWRVAYVCAACMFTLIIVSAAYGIDESKNIDTERLTMLGGTVGFLTGVAISYLVIVRIWNEEIHEFTDEIRKREANRKRLAEAIKDLGTTTHSKLNGTT